MSIKFPSGCDSIQRENKNLDGTTLFTIMTAIATGVVMTFEYLRWQALRPKFQGSKNIKAVKKKQSAGIDSNKTVTANQGPISEQSLSITTTV